MRWGRSLEYNTVLANHHPKSHSINQLKRELFLPICKNCNDDTFCIFANHGEKVWTAISWPPGRGCSRILGPLAHKSLDVCFSLYPQRDQWILKAYVIIIINRQAALCAAQDQEYSSEVIIRHPLNSLSQRSLQRIWTSRPEEDSILHTYIIVEMSSIRKYGPFLL